VSIGSCGEWLSRELFPYAHDSLYRNDCPFFLKTGACRNREKCSRVHVKPPLSQTILLANLYQRPLMAAEGQLDLNEEEAQV